MTTALGDDDFVERVSSILKERTIRGPMSSLWQKI
jgi:hypothetical protein